MTQRAAAPLLQGVASGGGTRVKPSYSSACCCVSSQGCCSEKVSAYRAVWHMRMVGRWRLTLLSVWPGNVTVERVLQLANWWKDHYTGRSRAGWVRPRPPWNAEAKREQERGPPGPRTTQKPKEQPKQTGLRQKTQQPAERKPSSASKRPTGRPGPKPKQRTEANLTNYRGGDRPERREEGPKAGTQPEAPRPGHRAAPSTTEARDPAPPETPRSTPTEAQPPPLNPRSTRPRRSTARRRHRHLLQQGPETVGGKVGRRLDGRGSSGAPLA